ncbi:hypothetical protein TD95_003823 [Thielaviopsis punctulata]|uniref:PUM-HD domain-containing protein n=1 Tax=Thielaviopsis punctulata TaxID=72032 RepID=A0A0F4ZGJ1_9PEZI|nr:hypothetical protein TD95_003823 [Thielaviopsis punctulata]
MVGSTTDIKSINTWGESSAFGHRSSVNGTAMTGHNIWSTGGKLSSSPTRPRAAFDNQASFLPQTRSGANSHRNSHDGPIEMAPAGGNCFGAVGADLKTSRHGSIGAPVVPAAAATTANTVASAAIAGSTAHALEEAQPSIGGAAVGSAFKKTPSPISADNYFPHSSWNMNNGVSPMQRVSTIDTAAFRMSSLTKALPTIAPQNNWSGPSQNQIGAISDGQYHQHANIAAQIGSVSRNPQTNYSNIVATANAFYPQQNQQYQEYQQHGQQMMMGAGMSSISAADFNNALAAVNQNAHGNMMMAEGNMYGQGVPQMVYNAPGLGPFNVANAAVGAVNGLGVVNGINMANPFMPAAGNNRHNRHNRTNSGSGSGSGSHGNNKRQSSTSAILEDIQKHKSRFADYQITDILGSVVAFTGDQNGSRFIQEKLGQANSDEKNLLFAELKDNLLPIMRDIFGNYVIQKFLELGSQAQKRAIGEVMVGKITDLSMNAFGCRVVQKAMDHVLADQRQVFIAEVRNNIMKLITNTHGNHVVQKAIEVSSLAEVQYLVDMFVGNVAHYAQDQFICRVMQRLLENVSPSDKRLLVDEVHQAAQMLISHEFGNYVAQHVIRNGTAEDQQKMTDLVFAQFITLSKHKHASNVVEACMRRSSPQEIQMLYQIVKGKTADGKYQLEVFMRDAYANYVVQTLALCLPYDDQLWFVPEVYRVSKALGPIISVKHHTMMNKRFRSIGHPMFDDNGIPGDPIENWIMTRHQWGPEISSLYFPRMRHKRSFSRRSGSGSYKGSGSNGGYSRRGSDSKQSSSSRRTGSPTSVKSGDHQGKEMKGK